MVNFFHFVKNMKLSWIKRFLDIYYLRDVGEKFILNCIFRVEDIFPRITNRFVLDCCSAWGDLTFEVTSTSFVDQVVWNNTFIKVDNQILFDKALLRSKVIYVRDFYGEDGNPLVNVDFITKYNCGNFPFIKLNGIHCSIPVDWRPFIQWIKSPRQPTSQHVMIARFSLDLKVCRYAYKVFNNRSIDIPRGFFKWNNVFSSSVLDWVRIFCICKLIRDEKIRNFQYKFLHRIIGTNLFLCSIKVIDKAECSFCKECEEDLQHLFWGWRIVASIWRKLEQSLFPSKKFVLDLLMWSGFVIILFYFMLNITYIYVDLPNISQTLRSWNIN